MSIEIQKQGNTLRVFLQGEIDHHSALFLRKSIDTAIEECRPGLLVLDFSQVSFMDSSGIGLVMGRYKLMKLISGSIRVENLSAGAYRVMCLAGLERLGEIKKKETVK